MVWEGPLRMTAVMQALQKECPQPAITSSLGAPAARSPILPLAPSSGGALAPPPDSVRPNQRPSKEDTVPNTLPRPKSNVAAEK